MHTEAEVFDRFAKRLGLSNQVPWQGVEGEIGGGETKRKAMGDAARSKSKGNRWPITARVPFSYWLETNSLSNRSRFTWLKPRTSLVSNAKPNPNPSYQTKPSKFAPIGQ